MSVWESIFVALDNLRMNKLRSFLTMIGIVFGVAAVVTVVSIGQAGQHAIVSELSNYEEGFFVIYPVYGNGRTGDNVFFRQREMAEIRKLPEIRYVSASISLLMTGKHKKEELQFNVTGTTADAPKMRKIDLVAGRFFSSQEERGRQKVLVVEAKFADKAFGSPQGAIGRSLPMSGGMFRIVGVYKEQESLMGGFGRETYSAYAPITVVSGEAGDLLSALEILPASPEQMDETIHALKSWLANRKNVSKNAYATESAKDAEQMIKNTFSILQTIIGSIAGISLLVGGIGVMNIMLVSVTERTREIGIRKAIGATPRNIRFQFMVEAVILCFIGGTIGAMFGLLAAWVFALISGWPFVISIWAILLAFGFSAAVGIFFGLYPAGKAAKLHPIESLRYE